MMLCSTCITTCTDPQGSSSNLSEQTVPPLLKSPASCSQTLKYEPTDEDRVIKRIVATGSSSDKPPMAVAFLLGLCLQYSSTCLHMSDVRRLLLLVASGVQSAVWVSSGKVCKWGCWFIEISVSHTSMQIKMGKKPCPTDALWSQNMRYSPDSVAAAVCIDPHSAVTVSPALKQPIFPRSVKPVCVYMQEHTKNLAAVQPEA